MRGKSRSSGIHGASGREGAAHMARAAHRGGGSVSAGSGWGREGEWDLRLVGWLGGFNCRWLSVWSIACMS
jgi:hypothetical protein